VPRPFLLRNSETAICGSPSRFSVMRGSGIRGAAGDLQERGQAGAGNLGRRGGDSLRRGRQCRIGRGLLRLAGRDGSVALDKFDFRH